MSSHIATLVFALGILALFMLYRDPKARTSKALWLPTIWILLASSRMVSVWLHGTQDVQQTASQFAEGSPLDRAILSALLVAGIIVLLFRARRVGRVLRMNGPILMFFFYCAVSTMWSDFPGLALKRWVKAIGDLVMVLIILTDLNRTEAMKRVIARVGFLLMPLSLLLIKYYPNLGRMYSLEDVDITNTGVTTNKNLLGVICLIVGLGCVWFLIRTLQGHRRRTGKLVAWGATLATVLWLFVMANSVTPLVCFLMGTALIVVVNLPGARGSAKVHFAVGGMLSVAALMFVFPELFVSVIHAFGRNPTLTGRTGLWKVLLGMDTHPWFGAGFESFWLGNRLDHVWSIFAWQPNEAHNGYIEVYLNLGWVGVGMLALLLVGGYRNVITAFRWDPEVGSLKLGYFAAALAYNFSEAGFRLLDPMWIFLLLAITAVPYSAPFRNQESRLNASQDFLPEEVLAAGEHIYARLP